MYPATIISVSPHIVKVDEFEEPTMFEHWFNYESWKLEWDDWLTLNSANWQLPVHEDSLKETHECITCSGDGFLHQSQLCPLCGGAGMREKMFYVGQKVSVTIKEGKAVIV